MTRTTTPLTWTDASQNGRLTGDLTTTIEGQTFLAVRHRTDYGWCHWELFTGGQRVPRSGGLPRHAEVYSDGRIILLS